MGRVKGLNPGRLKTRVAICRYTPGEDELGNTINILHELRKVWAEFRPLRGTDQLENFKVNDKELYKVTMRYTDITEKDVLVIEDRQFIVNYIIDPLLDHYILEVFVTENKDHRVKEDYSKRHK